jgi:hypothetical protein
MKKKLYKLFLKYSDKLAHAFYGTLFYLFCTLLFTNELSLFLTFTLAVGVEIYDKYNGGNSDTLDALATVLIPTILFLL